MDVEELEAQLRSLAQRVEALEAENARLRAESATALTVPVSRREWLARGAAVAAGAVAGTVAAGVTPAAAASGPINMNTANNADNSTTLQADLGNNPNLSVLNVFNLHTVWGAGVNAYGASFGLTATSPTGVAVAGSSPEGTGASFEGEVADLRLGGLRTSAPAGDAGTVQHIRGELAWVNGLSNSGDLWLCVKSGSPGDWRRISGYTAPGGFMVLANPIRVYDSRPGQVPVSVGTKSSLVNGVDRVVDCSANLSSVPAEANAVVLSVTAIKPNGAGWLSVRSSTSSYNGHSNLNFGSNTTIAGMCVTRCSSADVAVRLGGTATACDVAVDVLGYYR